MCLQAILWLVLEINNKNIKTIKFGNSQVYVLIDGPKVLLILKNCNKFENIYRISKKSYCSKISSKNF